MRKILILFLCLPLLSMADQRSDELLNKLSSVMKMYRNYEVQFNAKVDGGINVPGKYVVSGNRYHIAADDREIYSDGKFKYEVNDTDKEVTIDNVNPNDKDLLSNPTKAFEFVGDSFTHSYKGEVTYGGKQCRVVVLVPTAQKSAIEEITLMLGSVDNLPVGVRYRIKSVQEPIEIAVRRITPLQSVTDGLFVFDKNRHKGYEIVDFR